MNILLIQLVIVAVLQQAHSLQLKYLELQTIQVQF